MRQIALSKGMVAIVDDDDYEELSKYKWHILDNKSGYAARNSLPHETFGPRRHHILMHRAVNKTPDGMHTDHINGNKLDNRKENLRTVTQNENAKNRKKNAKGTSKYKGVYWHKQHRKWYAQISVNKKTVFLGLFRDEHSAHEAYEQAALRLFGQYKRENGNG